VFEVKVDDLSEGVHFRCLEVPDELCETFFELRVYYSLACKNCFRH
jgi:hypothetical protein